MSQILLFRFSDPTPDPQRVAWRVCDPRRPDRDTPAETGTLSDLAARAAGKRPVLMAPGEQLLLTHAQAPGRNRATWLKALPYALEDTLAGDVDDLHFAAGRAEGQRIPVAVIRRALLDQWLAACTEAHVSPVAVVPEPLLLPWTEDTWSVLLEPHRAVARLDAQAGFACEPELLPLLLQMALDETGQAPGGGLRVWGLSAPQGLEPQPDIHLQPPPPDSLALLAGGLGPTLPLNLLQGPYSRRAQISKWIRPWRAAAALVLVWAGLQVGFMGADYYRLSQEQDELRAEMERLYRQAVPDARRVVNPRVQLASRLDELRGGPAETDIGFLELLYRGGQTLSAFEGVDLRGLRYDNQRLNLDLEGASLEVLDTFKQRLTEQPDLEARMRTSKRDDRIESRVTLSKGAS